ncbi:MAG: Acetyl-CoA carboxylase, biotin carboxylase [Leptospirillum sp. Group II 'C75']|uniref:Biotin carboxylase n=1 Tax=Leptospirillum ferriphilum (strain ML-04) TaxID=1048260 RepID=J9ZD30_LEPFM|nr:MULTISPECIES: acetyl-CoA carboxylase biotin carboxylase subunit [Leptospirillum]AFS53733.1 acetyl-CoA carboxylase, biotin carboxylase subunit accC [Leptospirillum ferriphilum ML-04]AKS23320.1 acetyl-CoA carboxylase [Leptospirillum sp. Group II 'CF-1']EAY55884.1 MAG: Acetyl-CoA carboxylase, biotin carboxylase [Leptospirillum rubarum]EIJ76366.1 MAG: Acetyl-CoA carboxylase, biotin carboxylase [Leptospirillum sp. Group II 'C75']
MKKQPPFKKVLVANRGEIALRIIRACREMGVQTVAIYSTADRESLHVRMADEAVCVGPPETNLSYRNIPNIISAAEITQSEAIHPGYGFLSENAHFAEICQSAGVVFIGPSPESISLMGDKARAKSLMRETRVPVVPGSQGAISSEEEAITLSREIGYPLIIKASAGGGGRGMRIVHQEGDFDNALHAAQTEAFQAFGSKEVYIEKYFQNPRHVEIQILADTEGNVYALGERDCSIQRRHQKLVEESPSPVLSPKLRQEMSEAAVRAARAANYVNAGTVEFLVDDRRNFFFIEMNTRIQVEHPVTETLFQYDLVKAQIRIAAGLPVEPPGKSSGHAIECRINAEDPWTFAPSPGHLERFLIPGGPGVRVDTAFFEGATIPPQYDSLIAKLIVNGRTREEALDRMARALAEFEIKGIRTTIPFHIALMQDEAFRKGTYSTGFVEHFLARRPRERSDE